MSDSAETASTDASLQVGQYRWNVYRRPNGTVSDNRTITADNLVVEGGAAVFSIGDVVTWVFPPGEYLLIEKIN